MTSIMNKNIFQYLRAVHYKCIFLVSLVIVTLLCSGCDGTEPNQNSVIAEEDMSEADSSKDTPLMNDQERVSTAVCGDHVLAAEEECDDGNFTSGDGCDPSCILEQCGNGILQFGERCDEGLNNSDTIPNRCRTNCTYPRCGDAITDQTEMCDDGNSVQTDACRSSCILARCGDGILRTDLNTDEEDYEECDEGELNSDRQANACRSNCLIAHCGDGIRDAGEECDEGEQNSSERGSGAQCRQDCRLPRCGDGINDARPECIINHQEEPPPLCGNGVVDEGEECDQGASNHRDESAEDGSNNQDFVTCRSNCQLARCGDGIRDIEEFCDDGNNIDEPCSYGEVSCQICNRDCALVFGQETSYCGDGIIDSRELCDDGNNQAGDGCNPQCLPERLSCGNGVIDLGEDCDDGNYNDGDGCDFECKSECGNGALDLGEVCDEGDLNQTGLCDFACSYGQTFVRHSSENLIGAIPVINRNEDGFAIDNEAERASLYHDEYVFQVDGPTHLSMCFSTPLGENVLPADILTFTLERILSLGDGNIIELPFIENTELIVAGRELDQNACVVFDDTHLFAPGAYRVKVMLKDFSTEEYRDARQQWADQNVLRNQESEVHYRLQWLLYRSLGELQTSMGRIASNTDDLFHLTLNEESQVTLSVGKDRLGRCPNKELSRPILTVYRDLDGELGAVQAQEVPFRSSDRYACSQIYTSTAWPSGHYWIRINNPQLIDQEAYYLNTVVEPSIDETERLPFIPQRVTLSQSEFTSFLSARRSDDDLNTFQRLSRRYEFEVNTQDDVEQRLNIETYGCASGPTLAVSVWSVDQAGLLLRQIKSASDLSESHSQWANGICQSLSVDLSSGKYVVLVRHKLNTFIAEESINELQRKARLPFKIAIDQETNLGTGKRLSNQTAVGSELDVPDNMVSEFGLLIGDAKYGLDLPRSQSIGLKIEALSDCVLSYDQGSLPLEFDAKIKLENQPTAYSLKYEQESLANLGVVIQQGQFAPCTVNTVMTFPAGNHELLVQNIVDMSNLNQAIGIESALSARLPEYSLVFVRPELCGNGQIDGIEECDDGDLLWGGRCAQCVRRAVCGDGILERDLGESCDDGNLLNFDGCSSSCDQCGDGLVSGVEECEPIGDNDPSCDEYCTFKIHESSDSSFVYNSGAIAPGDTDDFLLTLREKAWVTIKTLGCENTNTGANRQFDTQLSLYSLNQQGDESLLSQANDQLESACAQITTYISDLESGSAKIVVESDRFNNVINYQLEVEQRVDLLIDQYGLCVKEPQTGVQGLTPRESCPESSFTPLTLNGMISDDESQAHRFKIFAKRQSYFGWEVFAQADTECPSRMYIFGFKDESDNPIVIDFESSANSCGRLAPRSWPTGQYELYIEGPSENSTQSRYTLTNLIPLPECGNEILELGEECEVGADGSVLGYVGDQDVCRDCRLPRCGDAFVDSDEECDDGNSVETDHCLSTCLLARCGDGYTQVDVEACDFGSLNDDSTSCLSNCQFATCGDGFLRTDLEVHEVGYEVCDDGNNADGDGCSSNCDDLEVRCPDGRYISSNAVCPIPPILPVCGNLSVEEGESCDDGNAVNGDGCNQSCQVERVFIRSGLFLEESQNLHQYEFTVDGQSRLVVETQGSNSLCDQSIQDPSRPQLDTVLSIYKLGADKRIAQQIVTNDDVSPTLLCSKIDQVLYQPGRYIIEVSSYGNEPLVPYRLSFQLTQDLSNGRGIQGRLLPGESDVYELTLYDLQVRQYFVDTESVHSDLSVSVINVDRSQEADPLTVDEQALVFSQLPQSVILSSQLLNDTFMDGDARQALDRVLIVVRRSDSDEGLLNYTIQTDTRCGDGRLNLGGDDRQRPNGEECDDGNVSDGDGCSAWCRIERNLCGNGVIETYTIDGQMVTESCDAGQLLTNQQIPPNFSRPNEDISNYEMTSSALIHFKEPLDTNIRGESFIIDTTAIDYYGVNENERLRLEFSIGEDETDLSSVAQRINDAFPSLIMAWGRDDELSLIIRGGLRSNEVQITLPELSPWKLSPIQPLCDQFCTPIRQRLVSKQTGIGIYQDFRKIDGKVEEGQHDVYYINVNDTYILNAFTSGCKYESADSPGIDTFLSLYRLDHGQTTALIESSEDLDLPGLGEERLCSRLENIELETGSYALYVKGYLDSELENYSLYYSMVRRLPNIAQGVITTGPEVLIYDELSDQFDTKTHTFLIDHGPSVTPTFKLFPLLEQTLCTDDPELGYFSVSDRQSPQNSTFDYCDESNSNALLSNNSTFTDIQFEFTPEDSAARDYYEKQGYMPLTYQYCADPNCDKVVCGNGIVNEGESCDDGNLIANDACTDRCLENIYYPVEPSETQSLDHVSWNELSLGDDTVQAFNIPNQKSFKYFNQDYNQILVSSNGFIMLQNVENTNAPLPPNTSRDNGCCNGGQIPLGQESIPLIAVYWEDLLGANMVADSKNQWGIYTDDQNQEYVVIEWKDIKHYGNETRIHAQIILGLDNSNVILRCEHCASDGGPHTQGLRGPYPYQGTVDPNRVARDWSASIGDNDGVEEILYLPAFVGN